MTPMLSDSLVGNRVHIFCDYFLFNISLLSFLWPILNAVEVVFNVIALV